MGKPCNKHFIFNPCSICFQRACDTRGTSDHEYSACSWSRVLPQGGKHGTPKEHAEAPNRRSRNGQSTCQRLSSKLALLPSMAMSLAFLYIDLGLGVFSNRRAAAVRAGLSRYTSSSSNVAKVTTEDCCVLRSTRAAVAAAWNRAT